ncbi:MAG TPA: phosphoglycerate dehydrogenase [Conexibacter sp.]
MSSDAQRFHAPELDEEILVTWPDYAVDHERIGGALADAGLRARLRPKLGARSPGELTELAAGAAGAIVSTDPFTADVLAATPSLRVIARVGIGTDSVDLAAATAHGVVVTVTPGANEATVADHTVAMALGILRRLAEHDASVRRGEWNRTGVHTPSVLSGATVGLVGYGGIGRLVAERMAGFGVRLLVHDPVAEPDGVAERVPLEVLLTAAQVVSLHVPLLPATKHLIGAPELALMRPDAVLVNTARGGVVDEAALVDALEQGRLRGAALDVFEQEPPRSRRLLALGNVLLSPHIAALSEQSVHEMTARATASVVDVLRGRIPRDVANPDVLERAVPLSTADRDA